MINASAVLLASLVSFGLYTLSVRRPPEWKDECKHDWKRVNLVSLIVSAVSSAVSVALYWGLAYLALVTVTVAVGTLSYCLVQSIYTDFDLHLVDRRMLYLSILVTFSLNFATMSILGSVEPFSVWLMAMLFCGALIFVPGIVGPSDGRALLLTATSAFPILGYHVFFYCMAAFIFLAVGFIFGRAFAVGIKARKPRAVFTYLTGKNYHPMVPFILFPFYVMLLFSAITT